MTTDTATKPENMPATTRRMRRELFRSDRDRALALLARAPFVHLAGAGPDGPVLKTVHGVIVGDALCFHAAPAGEKMSLIGSRVVVCAEEIVAEIPSYFTDPERACPATTLYESVQVHGVLERVDDMARKADALQALMRRFQPEGGHRPITADDPMYENAVRGILIAALPLTDVDGKSKLGQNRTPDERARLLEKLWEHGPARAVDLVREANARDDTVGGGGFLERRFHAPAGTALRCGLDASFADEAAALLEREYWNEGVPRATIARAHVSSSVHVGAVDAASGALVGTARALSDGAKWATIYDVAVRDDWRGRGLGRAIMRMLLDHPNVRRALKINLRTRDAQALYATLGFVERPSSAHSEMVLVRAAAADSRLR